MSPRSSVGHQHVVLSPLSTEFASDKSVDSGVGMSAQSDSLKSGGTRDSVYAADELHQAAKGSAATPSTRDGQAEVASEPAASDISDLVKNLQRVLSSSKSNITLNINSNTNTPAAAADSPAHTNPPDSAAASDEVCRDKKGDACQCPACLKQRKLKEKPITYAVEYLDMGDRVVSTDTRQTEYDLDEELKETKIRKSSTVFTVTTVLRTSIPSDDYRDYLSKEEEKDKEQILKNEDCTIGFHTFRLTIVSPALLDALRTHIVHYPGVFLWGDQLSITSPFCALAHHLQQLQKQRDVSAAIKDDDSADVSIENHCRSKIPSAQTAQHLTMLLDYLGEAYGDSIEAEVARNQRGACTFSMLWHLFRPGMTVYVRGKKTEDPPSAMIVSEVVVDPAILYRNDGKRRSYTLHLWYLDFDGDLVGRALSQKEIASFDGEKPIAELQVIPCDYIDRQDEQLSRDDRNFLTTRNRLVDLGKKWFGLLKGQMVFYNGEFPESPYTDAFSGRVLVDCDSYWAKVSEDDGDDMTSGPSLFHFSDDYQYTKSIVDCTCSACKDQMKGEKRGPFDSYWAIDPRETKSLELDESHWNSTLGIDKDHRYLICNHLLGGLVLKNRRWEMLNVACCSAIAPQAKAFENLVMNKSRKDLIKSLLYNYSQSNLHNAPKPWKADFIENKGDGRIFLLHGPPGVGKTYTAECIAEYTGRPLLSLTCGDIGISEQDVDRNLQKWFTIGEKWGAVVLVDEADVYLESRQPGDVQRNGLVSVFLRAVEYYKGILFLTTNRVGQFDDAFISRIHVVLRYEKLRPNDRRQIWEGFFEKLEKERGNQIRISKSAKKYVLEDKEMTGIPWNGREIRNAFQTAVALAQYKFATSEDTEAGDKAVLDRDHFEEVCKMTTDFKKYLKKLHTKDEDARAAIARNRYDEDDSEDD